MNKFINIALVIICIIGIILYPYNIKELFFQIAISLAAVFILINFMGRKGK